MWQSIEILLDAISHIRAISGPKYLKVFYRIVHWETKVWVDSYYTMWAGNAQVVEGSSLGGLAGVCGGGTYQGEDQPYTCLLHSTNTVLATHATPTCKPIA